MSAHGDSDDVVEKGAAWSDNSSQSHKAANSTATPVATSKLRRLNARIEGLSGFEIRGIARVPPEERHKGSRAHDLQIFLLWLSANLSLNNLGVGMLGPLLFNLGFVDCIMCAVVGAFIGSLSTGYTATFGPVSGNRTMVRTTLPKLSLQITDFLGCCSIFHGILAFQDSVCPQHCAYDWIRHH